MNIASGASAPPSRRNIALASPIKSRFPKPVGKKRPSKGKVPAGLATVKFNGNSKTEPNEPSNNEECELVTFQLRRNRTRSAFNSVDQFLHGGKVNNSRSTHVLSHFMSQVKIIQEAAIDTSPEDEISVDFSSRRGTQRRILTLEEDIERSIGLIGYESEDFSINDEASVGDFSCTSNASRQRPLQAITRDLQKASEKAREERMAQQAPRPRVARRNSLSLRDQVASARNEKLLAASPRRKAMRRGSNECVVAALREPTNQDGAESEAESVSSATSGAENRRKARRRASLQNATLPIRTFSSELSIQSIAQFYAESSGTSLDAGSLLGESSTTTERTPHTHESQSSFSSPQRRRSSCAGGQRASLANLLTDIRSPPRSNSITMQVLANSSFGASRDLSVIEILESSSDENGKSQSSLGTTAYNGVIQKLFTGSPTKMNKSRTEFPLVDGNNSLSSLPSPTSVCDGNLYSGSFSSSLSSILSRETGLNSVDETDSSFEHAVRSSLDGNVKAKNTWRGVGLGGSSSTLTSTKDLDAAAPREQAPMKSRKKKKKEKKERKESKGSTKSKRRQRFAKALSIFQRGDGDDGSTTITSSYVSTTDTETIITDKRKRIAVARMVSPFGRKSDKKKMAGRSTGLARSA